MRAGVIVGAAGVLLALAGWSKTEAQMQSACRGDALGVARTISLDSTQGPRYGNQQYHDHTLLRDGEVILTFDDGPHPHYTKMVLDALEAHCTRATFFMVGFRAMTASALVRDIARRGHTIGTHTWSHQDLAKIDPVAAKAEIELGISAVQKSLGAPAAPFFRFPYLSAPRGMQAYLKSRNTGMFSIDVDSYDYKTRSPTLVVRNVMQQLQAKKKGILLFHDIQPATAGAMKLMLDELKRGGFQVVHMRPAQGQLTVAEFDKRIDRGYADRNLASLPVSRRGVVAPGWEVAVQPPT
ncbi:MAG: polysaccharide deacetylase family protein, partial [Sphingomonadales bacterium]|nr:polysaccharide deacetylase family protein [Sphingomonadales bacterium]